MDELELVMENSAPHERVESGRAVPCDEVRHLPSDESGGRCHVHQQGVVEHADALRAEPPRFTHQAGHHAAMRK